MPTARMSSSLRKVRAEGADASLRAHPDGERVYVSIDIDAFDPSIAPGTATISHGGLTYYEARDILKEIARRFDVVGVDFVEVSPPYDPSGITSLLAARISLDFIGAIFHQRAKRARVTRSSPADRQSRGFLCSIIRPAATSRRWPTPLSTPAPASTRPQPHEITVARHIRNCTRADAASGAGVAEAIARLGDPQWHGAVEVKGRVSMVHRTPGSFNPAKV